MKLTAPDIAELRKLIKERVENYPDVESMVAAGELVKKGAWYEPGSKAAFDAIIQYARELRVTKDGKGQVKLEKPSARLKALANKF